MNRDTSGRSERTTKETHRRALTEKRRKQNRAAQRTYRERCKARLEVLERIVATVTGADDATSPSPLDDRTDLQEGSPIDDIEQPATPSQLQAQRSSVGNQNPTPGRASRPSHCESDQSRQRSTSNEDSLSSKGTVASLRRSGLFGNLRSLEPMGIIGLWSDMSVQDPDQQEKELMESEYQHAHRSLLGKGVNIDQSTRQEMQNKMLLDPIAISATRRLLQLEDTEEHNDLAAFATTQDLDLKTIILAGLRSLKASLQDQIQNPLQPTPPTQLPSPYITTVQPHHASIVEVMHHNALAIGLTLSQVCQCTAISPFHQNVATPTLSRFNAIPPDLRPTPLQLTTPHHPFYDLLPLPALRDRIIDLAMLRKPPVFDRWDVKRDVLNGGLVCVRRKRDKGNGQPWEKESWEATEWFRKKWGWLLDVEGNAPK